MKFNTFVCGCLSTIAAVSAAAIVFDKCARDMETDAKAGAVEIVRDTVYHFISFPTATDSAVIRYVTVKAPKSDTLSLESATRTDTLYATDSVVVSLPITQKVYQDSTYKAWVSGYLPSLDSIEVWQPITTVTKTEIKYKARKWGVGVQVGVGATPNRIEPYVGVGVTYNIFSW